MADVPRIDVLTALEVAAILQVNRNTVYDLAKAGTLASYNVGRKLRFTLDDVQAFIDASRTSRPAGASAAAGEHGGAAPTGAPLDPSMRVAPRSGDAGPAAPGAFVIGGRDMLLDMLANYLAAAGVRVLRSYRSCYRELVSLYFGEVRAAAVHLWDGSSGNYNLPYVKRLVPGTPVVVLHLATRTQGLLVRRNNPLGLRTWSDLARRPLVLANRERGSGSRVLLDEHLRMLEADPSQIKGYGREIASDLTQGALIAGGGADVGIGTERVSHQIDGLDYLPLQTEHLALVIAKTEALERTIRTVRGLLGTEMLRRELVALPGYDLARLGSKLYET
jgi:putative molybdopterin biosynthesis protein